MKNKTNFYFIHGWGLDHSIWQPLIERLKKNYQANFFFIDSSNFKNNQFNDIVKKLAEQIKTKTAIIIAHSLGAMLAIKLAEQNPNNSIKKLVLIAYNPKFVADKTWPYAMDAIVFDQFKQLLAHNPQKAISRFKTLQLLADESDPHQLKKIKKDLDLLSFTNAQSLKNSLNLLASLDDREFLAKTDLPIQIILGAKDYLVNPLWVDGFKKNNHKIEFKIIKKSAHLPMLTDAKKIEKIIKKFI